MTGSRGKRWIVTVAPVLVMLLALLGLAARDEAKASWLQARYFTHQAAQLTSALGDGPSDRIRFPGDGPHDRRFGTRGQPVGPVAVMEVLHVQEVVARSRIPARGRIRSTTDGHSEKSACP